MSIGTLKISQEGMSKIKSLLAEGEKDFDLDFMKLAWDLVRKSSSPFSRRVAWNVLKNAAITRARRGFAKILKSLIEKYLS